MKITSPTHILENLDLRCPSDIAIAFYHFSRRPRIDQIDAVEFDRIFAATQEHALRIFDQPDNEYTRDLIEPFLWQLGGSEPVPEHPEVVPEIWTGC